MVAKVVYSIAPAPRVVSQRNLEAKFALRDLAQARRRALAAGFTLHGVFAQRDTFCRVRPGKLKLREEDGGARLIHYRRHRRGGLQVSDYRIVPVTEPDALRELLAASLGTIAEVKKERSLLLRDNVRLHLDRVAGLGTFGEIEAVMAAGADPETNRAVVAELLATLGVARARLINVSYFEMIVRSSRGGPTPAKSFHG